MKNAFLGVLFASFSAGAALPEATAVSVSQSSGANRRVTISYELSQAPAVITVDIETNAADGVWASIGPAALLGDGVLVGRGALPNAVTGDVNRVVTGAGPHEIHWFPRLTWPDRLIRARKLRAVVTAWPTNMPPDYLVVDAREGVSDRLRYYPTTDWLPGGLFSNLAYRTTHFVMRRIPAKFVPWEMGSCAFTISSEPYPTYYQNMPTPFPVVLSNDYYIGVFEVTQGQWTNVIPSYVSKKADPNFKVEGTLRPMENLYYQCIRESGNGSAVAAARYPSPPGEGSFLYALRQRTGVDFDLPSEAQWEFAARAGRTDFHWGSDLEYRLDQPPDRYKDTNGGVQNPDATVGPTNGTAVVGSYGPNDFGLYDMFGNVREFCLDYWQTTIWQHHGATNAAGETDLDGNAGAKRTCRGGAWNDAKGTLRYRRGQEPNKMNSSIGFRLVCRAGLE